jgi:hypothetical protein
MQVSGSDKVQEADVWSLVLIQREEWTGRLPEEAALTRTSATLRRMGPALASLDRARCRTELYLSSIREEEQGGFTLPTELIEGACMARLELAVSILVMLSESDEDYVD